MEGSSKSFDATISYLKQQQELSKRTIREITKHREQFRISIDPIIEAQATLQKLHEAYITQHEFLKGLVSPAEQLRKSFQELPLRTRKALLLLGGHGWYLDFVMDDASLWELERALSKGNSKEAEEDLAEYFESRLDDIEESIIKKFPKREKVIRSAFKAHRNGEFELSVPVFLAQTDGICYEVTEESLFKRENNKPCVADYVKQVAVHEYMEALLSPLRQIRQTFPIGKSKKKCEQLKEFNELNRHDVLHGISLNYGTKTNSLKAVSLINYVSQVLHWTKKTSNHSTSTDDKNAAGGVESPSPVKGEFP